MALVAEHEFLAELWGRGLSGEELSDVDRLRFHCLMSMLFLAYENNHEQLRLGSVRRNSLAISRAMLRRILDSPGGSRWWERMAPHMLAPEFREHVEAGLRAS